MTHSIKHAVYLYVQQFRDGRTMVARWSPTIPRHKLGGFEKKTDEAMAYLEKMGWPQMPEYPDEPTPHAVAYKWVEEEYMEAA